MISHAAATSNGEATYGRYRWRKKQQTPRARGVRVVQVRVRLAGRLAVSRVGAMGFGWPEPALHRPLCDEGAARRERRRAVAPRRRRSACGTSEDAHSPGLARPREPVLLRICCWVSAVSATLTRTRSSAGRALLTGLDHRAVGSAGEARCAGDSGAPPGAGAARAGGIGRDSHAHPPPGGSPRGQAESHRARTSDPGEFGLAVAYAAPALPHDDRGGQPAVAQAQARLELERAAGAADPRGQDSAEGADVARADPGEAQLEPRGVRVDSPELQAHLWPAAPP